MSKFDFSFAWEGAESAGSPWGHLQVVEFRGHEELSGLYRYELTLVVKPPATEVDPHDLVQQRATLRINTVTSPEHRVVHGVITEAEEVTQVPGGMVYRVVLMPPLVRARYRRRCRIFLEKTTRQIIDAVLAGDPLMHKAGGATADADDGATAYSPATETWSWRLTDASRVDDVSVRRYCVQYNESDLDFVQRLLEEEGIAYHFENGRQSCLLVLSDRDAGRTRLDPFLPLGPIDGRELATVKLGARLRPRTVTFQDYNWKKPKLDMLTEVSGADPGDLSEFHYPGGYPDAPSQGKPLANALLERYEVEADYAVAEGSCRLLSAGSIFALEHEKSRYDGEYLVTKLQAHGYQQGVIAPLSGHAPPHPFEVKIECARRGRAGSPAESRFRPARVTHKPRIIGSQTAFVTADPQSSAEIQVGGPDGAQIGCVRVRFHWDREAERLGKEPSSCWVRVSQTFAGGGEGGVWHPRVGVEVIVDYEDGDPDRPIITGRVYNGANQPPAPSVGAPTISTFKSFTSPGGGKFNELAFDDAAGAEQIKLHAAKDWNSQVGNDRTENVVNDSLSNIGVMRTETTGANRKTSVGANNTETIGANHSHTTALNHQVTTGLNKLEMIGVNHGFAVGANHDAEIGANSTLTIGGTSTTTVSGSVTEDYHDHHMITVAAGREDEITGDLIQKVHGNVTQIIDGKYEQHVTVKNHVNHADTVTLTTGTTDDTFIGHKKSTFIGGSQSITIADQQSITIGSSLSLKQSTDISATMGAALSLFIGLRANVSAAVDINIYAALKLNIGASLSFNLTAGPEINLTGGPKVKNAPINVYVAALTIIL